MGTLDCKSAAFKSHGSVPHAVLKVQIKHLVDQHDSSKTGVIATRDLLAVIDEYEAQHDIVLLTPNQKTAILPYCLANPDLEMTPNDIINLLKLVLPPQPTASTSTPTLCSRENSQRDADEDGPASGELLSAARPRSSAPLGTRPIPWKRRPSALAMPQGQERRLLHTVLESPKDDAILLAEPTVGVTPTDLSDAPAIDTAPSDIGAEPGDQTDEDLNQQDIDSFYRKSMALNKRLKLSERNLDSMTRDNEDRIVQLQNSVDDMNKEVQRQRREILEYKSKEKNSLEQISTLEAHIDRIQRSETDQKQIYLSIKRLFDEKCEETQKLQEMLRQKELELQKTEAFLSTIHHEFRQSTEERDKLRALRKTLEHELATSHNTHLQLEEQRHENQRLKEIIDGLKLDLESRNELSDPTEPLSKSIYSLTLDTELEANAHHREMNNKDHELDLDTEERLKSVEHEKDYYKLRANEAIEDLDKANQELRHLKRALESENRSLVSELADLRTKFPERQDKVNDTGSNNSPTFGTTTLDSDTLDADAIVETCVLEPLPIHFVHQKDDPDLDSTTIEMNIPQVVNDIWAQSRVRLRKSDRAKKTRGFQDLNESTAKPFKPMLTRQDSQVLTKPNDKTVTNTVTFALYTLLVYIFGIVTSTFLLENGQAGGWEQALVAAASRQGGPRSNILEVVFYWVEKLIFDGLPLS